jgi:hypothetical protein
MAAPVTKRQIRALDVLAYEGVRSELRSGDLVFCSGS